MTIVQLFPHDDRRIIPIAIPGFDAFWTAYPKREGANPKYPARIKFLVAIKSGADPQAIVDAAGRYADEMRRLNQYGTRLTCQAATWLHQRRWEDYPAPVEVAPGGFYALAGSPQIEAWDAHRMSTEGRTYPRDKKGGWWVPGEWPR